MDTITARAKRTLDRLNRDAERKAAAVAGDRGAVVRHMERLAVENPYDKGAQWLADVGRRALRREHG